MATVQLKRTKLTDGSHVFDVVVTDGAIEPSNHAISIDCIDEECAKALIDALEADGGCTVCDDIQAEH